MINFELLRQDIFTEAKTRSLDIITNEQAHIEVIDYENFSRPTIFSDPATINTQWIMDKMWIHPEVQNFPVEVVAKILNEMDKNLLINLRNLVILPTPDVLDDYVKATFADYEYDEFYDMMPDSDGDLVGQFWYYASCPLVFMNNIESTAQDIINEFGGDVATERNLGLLTTILHECYHLASSNPFELDSIFEDTENAAEEFGQAQAENYLNLFRMYLKSPIVRSF